MKRSYPIEGLDCPNCAAKLEHALCTIPGVAAVVDFMGKRISIEADDAEFEQLLPKVIETASKIEPDANILLVPEQHVDEHEHAHAHASQKGAMLRIAIAAVLLGLAHFLPLSAPWRLLAFAVPYLIVGGETILEACKNILHGDFFDEAFLMMVATLGAFAIGEYPEAVGVMIFFQIGEVFEHLAVGKSRRSIAALMDIRPDKATVLRGDEAVTISPEEVVIGEIIRVAPGEKIPLDGVILTGETTVHTAALTGESVPQEKTVGDRVLSGSVNQSGVITMRVESSYAESTVSKILELVEHASEKKARAEAFITRFSRRYTPCVVILAILLALIPPLCLGLSAAPWIRRACIFLMVSCPCALVVSVPLSFFGGIGGASRIGILMKGANHLEMLSNIDTVVFDKTGTLTRGVFEVTAVHVVTGKPEALLALAASAEQYSSHPVAQSICRAYAGELRHSEQIEELAGLGVHAVFDGMDYYIGNRRLMEQAGATTQMCEQAGAQAGTLVHLARGAEYLGYIVISDRLKPDSAAAIAALKQLGIRRTVMLTGDLRAVAEEIGAAVGVDEIHAELLPAQKVEQVESLLAAGNRVAFVGDGINDAPVLMRADLGIAMGAMGSDAAMEAADIVLMDDNLSRLPQAIRISQKTMRIVRQNIILAIAVKVAILVLTAFGVTGMWIAVFGDVGVLILAVLNAMRALNIHETVESSKAASANNSASDE